MSNKENNSFSYSYSSGEQAELKRIREKYLIEESRDEPSTMERIRRLDAGVTRKAMTVSLIVGIIGTLIMGFGMSLVMTDLRALLGAYSDMYLTVGTAVGFVGIVLVIFACPLYHRISVRERKRIAPEILRLTDEVMGEKQ